MFHDSMDGMLLDLAQVVAAPQMPLRVHDNVLDRWRSVLVELVQTPLDVGGEPERQLQDLASARACAHACARACASASACARACARSCACTCACACTSSAATCATAWAAMPTTSMSPPAPPIPSSSPASEGSGECDGDALGVANMPHPRAPGEIPGDLLAGSHRTPCKVWPPDYI